MVLAGLLEVVELVLADNAARQAGPVTHFGKDVVARVLGGAAVHVGRLAAVGDVVFGQSGLGESQRGGEEDGLELHLGLDD